VSSELARISLLASIFQSTATGRVQVGIGDDAAVISAGPGSLVWTIDAQVEGTHFLREWLGWEDVGWRSFMAAASDLAAMGASPIAALSALVLPLDVDDAALSAIATGQAAAAAALGTTVAGGNLARGAPASITTTLLGDASRPILRSGAKPGDRVLLGGAIGLAAAGLAALEARADLGDPALALALAPWRRPRARLDLGQAMKAVASAAVDVSDGLLRDASHLAEASAVTIALDEAALLAHACGPLEGAARVLGRDPLRLALGGGEDYALVVASSSPIEGFAEIGHVIAGPPGVRLRRASGAIEEVEDALARGFDHFGGTSEGT
jgi:thiamine-monophosphate kinase